MTTGFDYSAPKTFAATEPGALAAAAAAAQAAPNNLSSAPQALNSAVPASAPISLSLGLGIPLSNIGDPNVFNDNMCTKVAEVAGVDKSKVKVASLQPHGNGMKCNLEITGSQRTSNAMMMLAWFN
eukprot:2890719-Rhodomonas_salina.2